MAPQRGGHDHDERATHGERIVLLTESGEPTGDVARPLVHTAATPLHLAFSFYGFDGHGRLLVTRRARTKPTWPGVWTNTCCGHPHPGERIEMAVRRRVDEELGLTVGRLWLALPAFRYRARMNDGTTENEICPVYVGAVGGSPQPDPAEVEEWLWLDWDDYRDDVEATRSRYSPWTILQVPALGNSGFIDMVRRPGFLGGLL